MKKTKNQWFANAMPAILSACVTLMVMIPLLLLGAILSRSDWMTETRYNTLGIICLAVFAVNGGAGKKGAICATNASRGCLSAPLHLQVWMPMG